MIKQSDQRHVLGKTQVRVCYDVWALLWLVLATFIFIYLITWVDYDPIIATKGLIGFALLTFGFVASMADQGGVGMVLDTSISMGEFASSIVLIVVGFFLILFVNITISEATQLSSTIINVTLFSLSMGISEEVLRGYLQNLFENMANDALAGVLIYSGFMGTLHVAIYGARNLAVLSTVLVSFVILSLLYAMSTSEVKGPFRGKAVSCRRISPLMTAHGLVNVTAGLRASMITARMALGVLLLG